MPVEAVGAVGPAQTSSNATGIDALKSDDFFRILVTELQQQDPLNPTETADMLSQVSDIRNIEVSKQLTDSLGRLADSQSAAGTGEMLGKFVSATMVGEDGTEHTVAGVVTAVHFDARDQQVFELDTGEVVLAKDVNYVTTPETAEALLATHQANSGAGDDKSSETEKQQQAPLPPWLTVQGWLPSWLTG